MKKVIAACLIVLVLAPAVLAKAFYYKKIDQGKDRQGGIVISSCKQSGDHLYQITKAQADAVIKNNKDAVAADLAAKIKERASLIKTLSQKTGMTVEELKKIL